MAQADAAQVSDESPERIARKMVKTSDSRADVKTLTSRLAALRNYLSGGSVDWAQAHGFVLDMAQQVMEGSAKKNDELWKAYPDLHKMSMSPEKGSKDYNEVLYKYGSWAEARKELAKHGVSLTLTKKGEVSRWDADFTELQGIGGDCSPPKRPAAPPTRWKPWRRHTMRSSPRWRAPMTANGTRPSRNWPWICGTNTWACRAWPTAGTRNCGRSSRRGPSR